MSQVSDRYAKALFDIAQEKNNLEAVENTMTDLRNLVIKVSDFRQFLSNPLLSYEERCTILKGLFEGKIPDTLFKFLIFVTFKGRLFILKEIIQSFDSFYLVHTHQLRAYVKTALPISDQEKVFINQHLENKFKQKIITTWNVDPSLIGGFRIFTQGKIYDYSFKEQLNHFYQQATKLV